MPIRLLKFDQHGKGITLVERSQVMKCISDDIGAMAPNDVPYQKTILSNMLFCPILGSQKAKSPILTAQAPLCLLTQHLLGTTNSLNFVKPLQSRGCAWAGWILCVSTKTAALNLMSQFAQCSNGIGMQKSALFIWQKQYLWRI